MFFSLIAFVQCRNEQVEEFFLSFLFFLAVFDDDCCYYFCISVIRLKTKRKKYIRDCAKLFGNKCHECRPDYRADIRIQDTGRKKREVEKRKSVIRDLPMLNRNKIKICELNGRPDEIIRFHNRREILSKREYVN